MMRHLRHAVVEALIYLWATQPDGKIVDMALKEVELNYNSVKTKVTLDSKM